jgi:peptidoglycan/LPS O-acetylase OafA/YrhL
MISVATGTVRFIDGLRGLAILSLVLWSAYASRDAQSLLFGARYDTLPIRDFGVGLELFAVISGFVIASVIGECATFQQFAIRRWLRLFPTMLVASIIILLFDLCTRSGPHADRTIINMLPGLSLVGPSIIHFVFRVYIDSLDGSFWAIYVVVSFYFVYGTSYFCLTPNKAIGLILAVYLGSFIMQVFNVAGIGGYPVRQISAATEWLGFIYFGWFAAGGIFSLYL